MGTLHLVVNVLILFDPYALTIGHNYSYTGVTYIFFQKYKWAHLIRKEIFFFFL